MTFKERVTKYWYFVLATFFVAILSCTAIYLSNPDLDAYFLIENGRYIFENKRVPTTNPWSLVENMGIIVQQPLCSLLNYGWYLIAGLKNMWVLALLENIVLVSVLNLLLKKKNINLKKRIVLINFFEFIAVVFCRCGTTRPYQLTICISILEIVALETYVNSKKEWKDFFKLLSKVGILSIVQANYQSSFLIMMLLWALCYLVPKDIKGILKGAPLVGTKIGLVFATIFGAGLLNPNGMNGVLYLLKSKNAINIVSNLISETKIPELVSLSTIILALEIVMFVLIYKNKKLNSVNFWMLVGTSVLVTTALRNIWMGTLALVCCYGDIQGSFNTTALDEKLKKKFESLIVIAKTFVLTTMVFELLLSANTALGYNYKSNICVNAVEYLNTLNKDDIVLYTTFNTGNYMEFSGYKIYMDARPELFYPDITGNENILQEWYNIEYSGKDNIEEFVDKYEFTHFSVVETSTMDTYLKYNENYECVSKDDGFLLYEKKTFN